MPIIKVSLGLLVNLIIFEGVLSVLFVSEVGSIVALLRNPDLLSVFLVAP
jgi:hypothetical protein